MANKEISIAIDGYSSTGKSTMAKALAARLGYRYIDTGAMYRAVSLYGLQKGLVKSAAIDEQALVASLSDVVIDFRFNEEKGESELFLNGQNRAQEIREPYVAEVVSKVAAISAVRRHLVAEQRRMASEGGIVMDGRDIGSVVLPNAELKIFMTADPKIRAERRFAELTAAGVQTSLAEVAANLSERDHLDTTRADSPLVQVPEAKLLDNSQMSREEQLNLAVSWVEALR